MSSTVLHRPAALGTDDNTAGQTAPAAVGADRIVRDTHHLTDLHVAKALLAEIMNLSFLFICHGHVPPILFYLSMDSFAADFPD